MSDKEYKVDVGSKSYKVTGASNRTEAGAAAFDSYVSGLGTSAYDKAKAADRAAKAAITARASAYYEKGLELFDNGDYDGALKEFEMANDTQASNGCILMIGRCYLENKKYVMAINKFKEITHYGESDEAYYYYWLAVAYDLNNQPKDALDNYNRTVQLEKNKGEKYLLSLYRDRAVLYANLNRWMKAAADWNKLVESGNNDFAPNAKELLVKHNADIEAEKKKFQADYQAAQNGNAEALYNLGFDYAEGIGVAENREEAKVWMEKAFKQGNDKAGIWLNIEGDEKIEKNVKKAGLIGAVIGAVIIGILPGFGFFRFIIGAVIGYGLGWLLFAIISDFKTKNLRKIKIPKERTAEEIKRDGSTPELEAKYRARYDEAKGLTYGLFSDKKAFPLFEPLAQEGYAPAQFSLGNCYRLGHGTKENVKKAIEWYIKAGEQGHVKAQSELGLIYAYGVDDRGADNKIPEDKAKAKEWYRKAADNGDEEAIVWFEEN